MTVWRLRQEMPMHEFVQWSGFLTLRHERERRARGERQRTTTLG